MSEKYSSEFLDDASLPVPFFLVLLISAMMVLTALSTAVVSKSGVKNSGPFANDFPPAPDLETYFPDQFAQWQRVMLGNAVLPPDSVTGPGEAVLYRAYRNTLGRVVTLVVAYGPPASDSVRLHRPEKCYAGQGFLIDWRGRDKLEVEGASIPLNRLMASTTIRKEAVTYWLRAGDDYAVSAAAHQWINLQQGLGRTADGVLVRISSSGDGDREYEMHSGFMKALLQEMSPEQKSLLIVQ